MLVLVGGDPYLSYDCGMIVCCDSVNINKWRNLRKALRFSLVDQKDLCDIVL